MAYKSYLLGDIYNTICEGDETEQELATIATMAPARLEYYMRSLKLNNPYKFGHLVVKAYTNQTLRRRLLAALAR